MKTNFMISTNNTIFENLNLKFKNKQLENRYVKEKENNSRRNNKTVSIISSTFSTFLFILFLVLNTLKDQEMNGMNLELKNISNSTLLDEIKQNQSSINSEFLFFSHYLLINKTEAANNSNLGLKSALVDECMNLVKLLLFLKLAVIFSGVLSAVYLIMLYFIHYINNKIFQNIFYTLTIAFQGLNFYLISAMLVLFFKLNSEYMYLVLSLKLIFNWVLVVYFDYIWLIYSSANLLGIIIEWSLIMSEWNPEYFTTMYLVINTLFSLFSCFISYFNFRRNKFAYYKDFTLLEERETWTDILAKMDQGLLIYTNENIIYNNWLLEQLSTFDLEDEDKSENFAKRRPKKINKKSNHQNLLKSEIYLENYSLKPNEIKSDLFSKLNIYEINNGRFSHSIQLNKLLFGMTDVNPIFIEYFEQKKGSSKFEDTCRRIIINKFKLKETAFNNFIYLGKVTIISEQKSSIKNINVFLKLSSKLLNKEIENIQFILNEVSYASKNNEEKPSFNFRRIALDNFAEEFASNMNFITEENKLIIKEIEERKENDIILNSISDRANFINVKCLAIEQKLEIYKLLSSLKLPCELICKEMTICKKCSSLKLCKQCKVCQQCSNDSKSLFNVGQEISKVIKFVNKINSNDQKIIPIAVINLEAKNLFIKTNKEILLNIILHLFIYTGRNFINIGIELRRDYNINSGFINTKIFIIFNSDIDEHFLKLLKLGYKDSSNEDLWYEKYVDEFGSKKFNKNFDIFVAFYLIKKLDSDLCYTKNSKSSIFSFDIKNSYDDLHCGRNEIEQTDADSSKRHSEDDNSEKTVKINKPIYINYSILDLPNDDSKQHSLSNCLTLNSNNNSFTNNILPLLTILIVDSDLTIRSDLKKYFENSNLKNKFNIKIKSVGDCFAALRVFQNYFKQKKKLDLIILEDSFEFMSGLSLTKLLRSMQTENQMDSSVKETKIIFYTNSEMVINNLFSDYVFTKNCKFEDLENSIEALFQ